MRILWPAEMRSNSHAIGRPVRIRENFLTCADAESLGLASRLAHPVERALIGARVDQIADPHQSLSTR